jgi:hypothetical protein
MSASKQKRAVSQIVATKLRAKQNQRDLIDVSDKVLFGLDQPKFKQFVVLLEAPPMRNEKLHTLLTTKTPWN